MSTEPRVAVVTGAARGVGRAVTHRLTAAGWGVVAVDAPPVVPSLGYALSDLATLTRACESAPGPGEALAHPADVREADQLAEAVAVAVSTWGGLDAAIACAGAIAGGANLWEVPAEAERAMIDINLGGVLALARVSIPAMLERPEPRTGRFVAVASAAATRGLPKLAAYCGSKAGVVGVIRGLAVELGRYGITANAVSPGSTATAMLDQSARLYDLPSRESFARQQPVGRLLDPDEIAAMAVLLAQPESGGITGADVPVDGGLSL
jgi:SDR family mycofactocin-dependent oxidoreductase